MNKVDRATRINLRLARQLWPGQIGKPQAEILVTLIAAHSLSVAKGDLQLLQGRWYVTHSGLLGLARRNRCSGIRVHLVTAFCDSKANRWAFKATVYKSRACKGFVGFGDADPSNVSALVQGAEMRIAETRAVNRALRKAYGIGMCSVEELGAAAPAKPTSKTVSANPNLGSSNGHSPHLLRDQLNALIQQHQLDPNLVRRYAAEFCGTQTLRDASKELIEDFISTLSKKASDDLAGLKCQLNGYETLEVQS